MSCSVDISDTHLTALFPGLPRWAGTRKVKPVWILLKQETVSGSDISWAICKSAPRSRQPCQHPTTLFLQAGCPSCRPTNSVKALKAIYHCREKSVMLVNWFINIDPGNHVLMELADDGVMLWQELVHSRQELGDDRAQLQVAIDNLKCCFRLMQWSVPQRAVCLVPSHVDMSALAPSVRCCVVDHSGVTCYFFSGHVPRGGVLPCRRYVARACAHWPFSGLSGSRYWLTVRQYQSPSASWYEGVHKVSSNNWAVGVTPQWPDGDPVSCPHCVKMTLQC